MFCVNASNKSRRAKTAVCLISVSPVAAGAWRPELHLTPFVLRSSTRLCPRHSSNAGSAGSKLLIDLILVLPSPYLMSHPKQRSSTATHLAFASYSHDMIDDPPRQLRYPPPSHLGHHGPTVLTVSPPPSTASLTFTVNAGPQLRSCQTRSLMPTSLSLGMLSRIPGRLS
jgi:hypothetical protein